MTFHVGQKVVCIKGNWRNAHLFHSPNKGEVYTIRSMMKGPGPHPMIGLRFCEIVNCEYHFIEGFSEPSFDARFFRPVVSPKSEISFTTGADPETEKFDNRRKVMEPTR